MSFVSTHSRPKAAAHFTVTCFHHIRVSTHSRPKAAAHFTVTCFHHIRVSTHSRPKAAASARRTITPCNIVSTHSRPKAAAATPLTLVARITGFNTQPPEGGCIFRRHATVDDVLFQHTAARRRLHFQTASIASSASVSTHSRPKAAAFEIHQKAFRNDVSTHSHPKVAA